MRWYRRTGTHRENVLSYIAIPIRRCDGGAGTPRPTRQYLVPGGPVERCQLGQHLGVDVCVAELDVTVIRKRDPDFARSGPLGEPACRPQVGEGVFIARDCEQLTGTDTQSGCELYEGLWAGGPCA